MRPRRLAEENAGRRAGFGRTREASMRPRRLAEENYHSRSLSSLSITASMRPRRLAEENPSYVTMQTIKEKQTELRMLCGLQTRGVIS